MSGIKEHRVFWEPGMDPGTPRFGFDREAWVRLRTVEWRYHTRQLTEYPGLPFNRWLYERGLLHDACEEDAWTPTG